MVYVGLVCRIRGRFGTVTKGEILDMYIGYHIRGEAMSVLSLSGQYHKRP